MQVPPRYLEFWKAFAQSRATDPTPRFLEAFYFDDNAPSANELAQLVLAGRKRATAALLWSYQAEDKRVPEPGDLSIVTDFSGDEVCVIETTRVDVVAFSQVSAEFAATEGEGDGSLEYWRRVHTAFFGRDCLRIGRALDADMPIVCERFELVFNPDIPLGLEWPARRVLSQFGHSRGVNSTAIDDERGGKMAKSRPLGTE